MFLFRPMPKNHKTVVIRLPIIMILAYAGTGKLGCYETTKLRDIVKDDRHKLVLKASSSVNNLNSNIVSFINIVEET